MKNYLKLKTLSVLEYGPILLRSNTSNATKEVKDVKEFTDFLNKEKSVSFSLSFGNKYCVSFNNGYVEWNSVDSITGEVIEIHVFKY